MYIASNYTHHFNLALTILVYFYPHAVSWFLVDSIVSFAPRGIVVHRRRTRQADYVLTRFTLFVNQSLHSDVPMRFCSRSKLWSGIVPLRAGRLFTRQTWVTWKPLEDTIRRDGTEEPVPVSARLKIDGRTVSCSTTGLDGHMRS